MKNSTIRNAEARAINVADGTDVPAAPWHYGAVQAWLSWRKVQAEMGDSTSLKNFSADCGSTMVRVVALLSGLNKGSGSFDAVHKWCIEISASWKERGVPYDMWLLARPDGTIGAKAKQIIVGKQQTV
tara:strand:- start:90 stop:473 length:384 start_codon:yes stop_codon:yes gene_type:complete